MWKKIATWTGVGIICLLCLLLMSILVGRGDVLGYRTYCVASGSMSPALDVGDVVYVTAGDPEVGDIVVLSLDGQLITHRIVSVENGDFVTKGDANDEPDTFENARVVGIVRFHLPLLGYLALRTGASLSDRRTASVDLEAAVWETSTTATEQTDILGTLVPSSTEDGSQTEISSDVSETVTTTDQPPPTADEGQEDGQAPSAEPPLAGGTEEITPSDDETGSQTDRGMDERISPSDTDIGQTTSYDTTIEPASDAKAVVALEAGSAMALGLDGGHLGESAIASLDDNGNLELDFSEVELQTTGELTDVFRISNRSDEAVMVSVSVSEGFADFVDAVKVGDAGRCVTLEAAERRSVAIRLKIPEATAPADYRGLITVAAGGCAESIHIPVVLTILAGDTETFSEPDPSETTPRAEPTDGDRQDASDSQGESESSEQTEPSDGSVTETSTDDVPAETVTSETSEETVTPDDSTNDGETGASAGESAPTITNAPTESSEAGPGGADSAPAAGTSGSDPGFF